MPENSRDEFIKIARDYLLENVGDDVDIFEEYIEECDDLILFYFQSKKFLKTRKQEDQYIGFGPLFIIKKDKKVMAYGSAAGEKSSRVHLINQLNKERLIKIYYKDYSIWDGKYNLVINELNSHWEEIYGTGEGVLEELVNVLLKHKIYNSALYDNNNPESYYYTKEQLKKALRQPPFILESHFCEKLEDLLVDLINTNIYLDWTLSEVK